MEVTDGTTTVTAVTEIDFTSGATVTDGGGGIAEVAVAGGAAIGNSELVYRYTVTGSDKASIDTGVDTPDAGSNDWTNGDLLEIFVLTRTDDAAAAANIAFTVNNDGSSSYDYQRVSGNNTGVGASAALAQAVWQFQTHGSGGSSGYAGSHHLVLPAYAGTTFWKTGAIASNDPDATATTNQELLAAIGYRSTSAITRFKAAAVSTAKLKVGSQLLIYKRLAS